MKKVNFFSFWLLLALGAAIIVFNSCGVKQVTSINLDKQVLTLYIGEDYTLKASVLPKNATDKTVIWASSANTIANISNGKVIAISEGMATITAKAGDRTAACIVTVIDPRTSDKGVVINGVKWATRNVDAFGTFASKPESQGKFYQWNRKTAWDGSNPTGTDWEKANDPSPEGWRVPTLEEIKTLLNADKVSNEPTKQNGINGRKFTDKATGNSLFLPASGFRLAALDGMHVGADSYGYYWSSTEASAYTAYLFYIVNASAGLNKLMRIGKSFLPFDMNLETDWSSLSPRKLGCSIRPVAE